MGTYSIYDPQHGQYMPKQQSNEIGYKATQSIYYASNEVADYIGYPLNTLVTINFSLADIDPALATDAFKFIRSDRMAKWAKRPRKGQGAPFPLTYAYAFENARGGQAFEEIGPDLPHNIHVLWYVHVPPNRHLDFEGRLIEVLDEAAGHICPTNAIRIDPVLEDNGIAGYLIKGAKPPVAKRFGAAKKQSPQGRIIGKRTGVSQNIGPGARRAMDAELRIDRVRRLHFAA